MKNVPWSPTLWAVTFPRRNDAFRGALPIWESSSSLTLFHWKIPNNPYFCVLALNDTWSKSHTSKTCKNNEHLVQPWAWWKKLSEIWVSRVAEMIKTVSELVQAELRARPALLQYLASADLNEWTPNQHISYVLTSEQNGTEVLLTHIPFLFASLCDPHPLLQIFLLVVCKQY